MNITILGTGITGLSTCLELAGYGHSITCIGYDELAVARAKKIFYCSRCGNKITATTNLKSEISKSGILYIAAETPRGLYSDMDISDIVKGLKAAATYMVGYTLIVIANSVPHGTCDIAKTFVQNNLLSKCSDYDIVKIENCSNSQINPGQKLLKISNVTAKSKGIIEQVYQSCNCILEFEICKSVTAGAI